MSFYLDNGSNLTPPEDERKIVYHCNECGSPIRYGDGYCELDCNYYCDKCIEENHRYTDG